MTDTSSATPVTATGRRRPRVAVLGSLNMDITVTVPRLPEPGATVLGSAARFSPGGKGANQAVAAARLGAAVRMVGCVGDDEFGSRLVAALRSESVDVTGVRRVPGVPSGLALITVDPHGENMITVAPGANDEVHRADAAAARDAATTDGASGAALVVSAEIPFAAVEAALAQPLPHAVRVLNLAPASPDAMRIVAAGVDWLVVNESEAGALLDRPVSGVDAALAAAGDLVAAGARFAVVTVGAAGAALAATDRTVAVPGFRVRAVDSVGAGDTFVGALAGALAAGVAPDDAVRAACAAAAVTATGHGTQAAMPRPADVLAVTGAPWPVGR